MGAPAPIIRAAGEGDKRSFLGGGLHTWKLLAEDTGGAFFLFEDVMMQGKTTPLHRHPEADETIYVLEGETELRGKCGVSDRQLAPGRLLGKLTQPD
jgi:quercetin dioxygenase-like cupin family protein